MIRSSLKIIFISLLIIAGCSQPQLRERVFSIDEKDVKVTSEINNIKEFESLYCALFYEKKGDRLVLPFNFEEGKPDPNANFGIRVIGHPFNCGIDCCTWAQGIMVLDSGYYIYDGEEKIELHQIDSIIRNYMLSYGEYQPDPESPEDALFILKFAESMELKDTGPILSAFSESYLSIISEQLEFLDLQTVLDSFPLNLILTEYVEPPPMPELDSIFEILDIELALGPIIFNQNEPFTLIKSSSYVDNKYPADDREMCEEWSLSASQIVETLKSAEPISGHEWHYLFNHYPCTMKGALEQRGDTFTYVINAGSWLTILSDTTVYYGDLEAQFSDWFIEDRLTEEDYQ